MTTNGSSSLPRKSALWLVPLFLLVHNLEEALLMPRFLPLDPARFPAALRPLVPDVRYAQFLPALVIFTLLPFIVAAVGKLDVRGSRSVFILLVIQAVMLVNVASHLGSAFLLGGYSPGLVTALLLNLPFSIYLFRRAAAEEWISRRALLSLPLAAVLVHGPLLIGVFVVSGWLANAG